MIVAPSVVVAAARSVQFNQLFTPNLVAAAATNIRSLVDATVAYLMHRGPVCRPVVVDVAAAIRRTIPADVTSGGGLGGFLSSDRREGVLESVCDNTVQLLVNAMQRLEEKGTASYECCISP